MNWILHRLRRTTLTTIYLPEIDGLRFLAISAVIFCHLSADLVLRHGLNVQTYSQWIVDWAVHNERGVHLFFTISGFILALPFAKRYLNGTGKPDLKKYFLRRLFRLEPPYLLNVILLTLATWAVVPSLRATLVWHFLAGITYTHLLIFHYVNPINMIWWSLEIEAQFYILMPLLAQVFKIRNSFLRRGILVVATVTAFAWQNVSPSWIVQVTILSRIQFFLAGLLAADLFQTGAIGRSKHWYWDVCGLCSLIAICALPQWWLVVAPVLTGLVVMAALSGVAFRRFLSLPWISAIGSMCYTIYLWHVFVMAGVLKLTLRFLIPDNYILSMITQGAFVVPAIFFFSVVLFLLVEKPCMQPDWPIRLQSRLREAFRRSAAQIPAPETE